MATQTTLSRLSSDQKSSVIAVYSTHDQVEATVKAMQKAMQEESFDMTKLSIAVIYGGM